MPLDPATLDSSTPHTLDGRPYPDHLRPYEKLDDELLRLFGEGDSRTFDELSLLVDDLRVRAALPRWIASATWRGLIERAPDSNGGPRRYSLTTRARHRA